MIHLSKYRILMIFILLSTVGVYSCRNSSSREEKKDTDQILLAGSSILHNLNAEGGEDFSSKSLFLERGGNKMALIFIDNKALPSHVINSAKEKISTDLGIQGANILIVQSASFQSASRDSLFFQEPAEISHADQDFIDKISKNIKEAQKNVQEAEIAWANAGLTSDSLRLEKDGSKEDTIKNPALENTSSDFIPEASFLAVQSISGEPIALLGNYNPESGRESDLPSSFYRGVNKQIESLIGQLGEGSSFISVFLPASYMNMEQQEEDSSVESLSLSEQTASSIAAQYQRLEFHQNPPLISSTKNVTLQLHSLATLADTSSSDVKEASKSKTSKEYPKEADFPLQTLLIGEYALAALPFEVSQETASKIKEANVFSETMIIPYGNGNWGRLPSSARQENETNERNIDNNIFQEDAALIVSDQILDQFSALRAERK